MEFIRCGGRPRVQVGRRLPATAAGARWRSGSAVVSFDVNAQQVVHVPGHRVAGSHLGPSLHPGPEFLHRHLAALLQLDRHVGQQAQADARRVDQRHVLADDTQLLQPPNAAQAGRGRQRHPLGDLLVGQAAILLQQLDDAQIGAVQFSLRH